VARQERLLLSLQKTVEDLVRRIDRTQAGDNQDVTTVPLGAVTSDDAATDLLQANATCETSSEGGSEGVSENTAAYDIEAGDLISSEGLNHLRAQRAAPRDQRPPTEAQSAIPAAVRFSLGPRSAERRVV
jgi:hypothetical protein